MPSVPRLFIAQCLCSLVLLAGLPAMALAPPTGKVVLTISGKVAEKNATDAAVFDMAMLEKLPQQTFTTMTPWDKAPIKFTGPLLRDVLQAAKASGKTIKALALNDYQTSIPLDDAQKFDVIVAHRMNDASIPVRTKGPLFIVYPYDANSALRATTITSPRTVVTTCLTGPAAAVIYSGWPWALQRWQPPWRCCWWSKWASAGRFRTA